MKTIAIEEHFITPFYRKAVHANEFRNFYLTSRSKQLGHSIVDELADLGEKRLAHMDAAGIDVQVLSFGSPGPQGFGAETAIPMARDANDILFDAVQAHPQRFA
ncbi:MAG: amidohydrolase, partial [Giesbergeria sp.]|nr:amidohydrolase [Giesbergeria sp.]